MEGYVAGWIVLRSLDWMPAGCGIWEEGGSSDISDVLLALCKLLVAGGSTFHVDSNV